MSRPILPSTTALRVFEAAARHLSCTGAGEELFLTQSAVSKQIRTLEESLGVELFVRVNRGLVLTDVGSAYLDEVRPILSMLALASNKIAAARKSPNRITLRVLAILGDRWLLTRFSSFASAYPEIEVQFTSFLSRDGQEQTEPDGEFRFGDGSWPGLVSDYLFGRSMVLVASPGLLARHPAFERPEDVRRFPLLQHFQVPMAWNEFATTFGIGGMEMASMGRHEFYSTLIRASVVGLGLALVPRMLVHDELMRGELVNPLALGFPSRLGYYFSTPEHKATNPSVAQMRAWLAEQARITRQEHHDEPAMDIG